MDDYSNTHGGADMQKTDYTTIENAAQITGLSKGRIYQIATGGQVKALPPCPMLIDLVSLKEYTANAKPGRPLKKV